MGKDVWWDWRSDWASRTEPNLTTDQRRVDAIAELASRCLLLEDLPETVKAQTIDASMSQLGTVLGVKLLKSPVDQKFLGRALVELESVEKKVQVMKQHDAYLFMLGGIPRPARAVEVTPALMQDHPWRRNPNITLGRGISKSKPNHPLYHKLQEQERIARQKHDDEQKLHKSLRGVEELRARKQDCEITETKEKLEMIAVETNSGSIDEIKKLHDINQGPKRDG